MAAASPDARILRQRVPLPSCENIIAMESTTYLIKVIRKGREKDYFDFWRRQRETNAAGEALNAELVGFEVSQIGQTQDLAVAAVRKKHPGLQVDVEGIQRLAQEG